MRFLRVKLTNWRGAQEREIRFGEAINVIVGRNEVGKSSLFEAIRFLFEFKAGSKHRDIRAVQPAGEEVGPEAELEFEFGGHRVIYRKRWLTRAETELRVLEPRAEQLSGDEAHEHMEELLAGHCDLSLWRALCVQQGAGISQAKTEATSLAAALERRRGAGSAENDAPELRMLVEEAFLEYWTKTGLDSLATKETRAKALACSELEAQLRQMLDGLDVAITTLEEKRDRLAGENERTPELRAELEKAAADLRAVEDLKTRVDSARQRVDIAKLTRDQAKNRRDARNNLRARIEQLDRDAAAANEVVKSLEAGHRDLDEQLRERESSEKAARLAFEAARTATTVADLDIEILAAASDASDTAQRLEKLRTDEKTVNTAEAEASALDVDDERLAQLREARENVRDAESRLRSAGGAIRVEAHRELELRIGEQAIHLASGEVADEAFGAEVVVALPGIADIRVRGGASLAELESERQVAVKALASLCWEAGVDSLEAAEERRARATLIRRRAEDVAERLDREVTLFLGSKAKNKPLRDRVERLIRELAQSLLEHEARASAAKERLLAGHQTPTSKEEALAARDAANATESQALETLDTIRAALEELRKARDARIADLERERGRRDVLTTDSTRERRTLTAQESEFSDEQLNSALEAAETLLTAHSKTFVAMGEELEKADAETIAERHANAHRLVEDSGARRQRLAAEVSGLETRVELSGGEGLHERLGKATADCERARRALAEHERRAAAAKMLHDVVSTVRLDNRQRYLAPLADRIVALGRPIFGPDLRIELDENLEVATRTLDGKTLEFSQLSTGAKEQLAILHRLACARLVSEDEAVPLVLDDVLGSSDPERLARLNVVLATKGAGTQVMLVTSDPERYARIGGANVIDL